MRPSWDAIGMELAGVIAKRSRCVVRQVGVAIASEDWTAWTFGFNGAPGGYTASVGLTDQAGCTSYCPQGSASPMGSTGSIWIGTPQEGFTHTTADVICMAVHAEVNALMKSSPATRTSGTIFSTAAPCWKCSVAIANSGIKRLVIPDWESSRLDIAHNVHKLYGALGIEIVKVAF